MKIAIIQPRAAYHVAGSEKISFKHAEYLSQLGHTVIFYTSRSGLEESFLFKDFKEKSLGGVTVLEFDIRKSLPSLYEEYPDTAHRRWITESIAFDQVILKSIESESPDIILSYYLPDSIFKPFNIANVLYISGYPSEPILWYKSLIRFCSAAITISSVVAEKWSSELQEVSLVYSLGTGVDYPVSIRGTVEKMSRYDIVFAGRLTERKGVLTLIEAFKEILLSKKDVHLWIVGEGELLPTIERYIQEHDLGEKITLTGLVQNPSEYFSMSDICVFPSHYGDGLMGTVLEAMATGKPVITTQGSGSEDIIAHGQNGLLIQPNDPSLLAKALLELLENEEECSKMGNNAKAFISDHMTWKHNAKKMECIFKEIISKVR